MDIGRDTGSLQKAAPATAQSSSTDWDEEYAYTLGLQAYIYGSPWSYLFQLRWLWTSEGGKALAAAQGRTA